MKSLIALSLCIIGTTITRIPDAVTAFKLIVRSPALNEASKTEEEDAIWASGSESEEHTTTTTKKPKKKCDCLPIYFPVCANNITFLNQCEYECAKSKQLKKGMEPLHIQCTGACDRCLYLEDNSAIEYDTDYYIPHLPPPRPTYTDNSGSKEKHGRASKG